MILPKIITAIILVSFISIAVYSSSSGIAGRTRKTGGSGCSCHSNSPNANVTLSIVGPDTVSPGQVVTYIISMTGGPLIRGGIDIAAQNGILDTIGTEGTRKISGEIVQSQPKAPIGGEVIFQFRYTAPITIGKDTIYAVGNSVDFTGGTGGDQWNHMTNKTLVIRNPVGIINNSELPKAFKLEQNYPNPFNPSTKIKFEIPPALSVAQTSLSVYDILGKEVVVLVNEELQPGTYEVEWNSSNYPSGIYYYTLSVGQFTETKKAVLIK